MAIVVEAFESSERSRINMTQLSYVLASKELVSSCFGVAFIMTRRVLAISENQRLHKKKKVAESQIDRMNRKLEPELQMN